MDGNPIRHCRVLLRSVRLSITRFQTPMLKERLYPLELLNGPLAVPLIPSPIRKVPPVILFDPPGCKLTVLFEKDDPAGGSMIVTVPPLHMAEAEPDIVNAEVNGDKKVAACGSILILPPVMVNEILDEP